MIDDDKMLYEALVTHAQAYKTGGKANRMSPPLGEADYFAQPRFEQAKKGLLFAADTFIEGISNKIDQDEADRFREIRQNIETAYDLQALKKPLNDLYEEVYDPYYSFDGNSYRVTLK